MPLQAPVLDTRKFEDLLAEALLQIPRYNPAWTDFNESDPGITLVQLFAWFTELMLYQFNQVPDLNYIKFLQLIGLELRPAQPATAHLTFTASAGVAADPVPQGTQIVAPPAAGGPPLIFETEAGVGLIRATLDDVQVFDGAAFSKVSKANSTPGTGYEPLGLVPQIGSALLLGFTPSSPPAPAPVFPQEIRLRIFLPPSAQAGTSVDASVAPAPLVSPVELVWEYRPAGDPTRWQSLNVYSDETAGFTREGYVLLEGPQDIAATAEGRISDLRYWLRARVASGAYPAGKIPSIDFVRPNTVPVINLATISQEQVGVSDGTPTQTFLLAHSPVVQDSLVLLVQVVASAAPQQWTRVDDFLASGKDDTHYVFNPATAQIKFGDGKNGRIPQANAQIVADQYRFGGGLGGNLPAGAISAKPSVNGLDKVTNERPAVGGRDEQTVSDLMQLAPSMLRSRNRAVTQDDFASLATQAGGVAKATAIAQMHPDYPGVQVPGSVTVVIVPDTGDVPPIPSSDQLRSVATYLNQFRLLTTELYVKAPQFVGIEVDATVVVQPYASPDVVVKGVLDALGYYLDPLARPPQPGTVSQATLQAAGTESWNFGEALHPTNLFSVILGVSGVVFVRTLSVTVDGQPHTDLSSAINLSPDGLFFSGAHRITTVPAAQA